MKLSWFAFGANKDFCDDADTTYRITQSSIHLYGEVQCAIRRRVPVAKPNAWLLDLACKTVDQGSDVRQSLLMLDDTGDLYEYSRGTMNHFIKCPSRAENKTCSGEFFEGE